VDMYRKFGYSVYRRVRNYYSGQTNEDAYGKRKGKERKTIHNTLL
jgi:N-terminal acetyltransferase B complex catalytic subunit